MSLAVARAGLHGRAGLVFASLLSAVAHVLLSACGVCRLQKYQRNLKRAHLDDRTIMLWDTPALQEANVPAGPRLLILHHINSFRGRAGVVSDLLTPGLPVPQYSKA